MITSCDSAKPYIVLKRGRTWGWQEKMLVPKTRTNYAEQRTRSCAYLRWIGSLWAGRADESFRAYVELSDPQNAICHVFGNYCSEALAVSRCESHLSIHAENGQYLGLFQMGSSERRTFGHGNTALEQAVAAYKYFVASGRDWSPWECQP